MNKQYFEAVAILVGTIIGAGVLGIPYVVAQSGIVIGLAHLILLGVAVLFINLYVAEISLRTKKKYQLVKYAEKYTGKVGKWLMTFAMVVGIYGALIAYIIGEGQSLSALFGLDSTIAMLSFFVIMSILIYLGLNIIESWELILGIIMLGILMLIIFLSLPHAKFENLLNINLHNLFLPYGVILFSFIGAMAIPEMKETLKHHKNKLKNAIILGSLIPIVSYILFVIVSVAVTGINTEQIATIGLGKAIGTHMILLGNLFAIFSMATSFLALGLGLQWMYTYDFGLKKNLSFILTISLPLFVVLLNLTSFVQALSITGAIAGGIEGIVIVFMLHNARKKGERKPEFTVKTNKVISTILATLFILGIIYTFVTL
ncbi:hypothetical protein D6777_03850 [Candidatus Woesearchaeota archaeon]|nr:MAG: hypothetical protein D6777_03850 [Candidatus Woesearchaeota archaeon]